MLQYSFVTKFVSDMTISSNVFAERTILQSTTVQDPVVT